MILKVDFNREKAIRIDDFEIKEPHTESGDCCIITFKKIDLDVVWYLKNGENCSFEKITLFRQFSKFFPFFRKCIPFFSNLNPNIPSFFGKLNNRQGTIVMW